MKNATQNVLCSKNIFYRYFFMGSKAKVALTHKLQKTLLLVSNGQKLAKLFHFFVRGVINQGNTVYKVNVNPLYRSVETANPPFTRTTVFIQTFSKGSFSIKRKLRGSLPVSLRINLGFKKKVPYRYLFQEFSKGVFLSGILMMQIMYR